MRRRDFIVLGLSVAWSDTAHAEQPERGRRVGVLSNKRSDDPEDHNELAVFVAALEARVWVLGRNLQIEYR
jgi:putative ABC transport system substrate-binding protein